MEVQGKGTLTTTNWLFAPISRREPFESNRTEVLFQVFHTSCLHSDISFPIRIILGDVLKSSEDFKNSRVKLSPEVVSMFPHSVFRRRNEGNLMTLFRNAAKF